MVGQELDRALVRLKVERFGNILDEAPGSDSYEFARFESDDDRLAVLVRSENLPTLPVVQRSRPTRRRMP